MRAPAEPDGTADSPVEAVVFDLDGVLVDSEELWDEVRRDLAAAAGVPWPRRRRPP